MAIDRLSSAYSVTTFDVQPSGGAAPAVGLPEYEAFQHLADRQYAAVLLARVDRR